MKLLTVTDRGHENWHSLEREDQYEAAMRLADAIHRSDSKRQISPDATSVGTGPRESSPDSKKHYDLDEVVLIVDVAKKRAKSRCKSALIPEFVQASIPIDGRRRVLAIPTDVRNQPEIPKGQADPFKVRAESQERPPNQPVNGSFCALVKNTSGNEELRYVLTCHHVAFLSLNHPQLLPDLTTICRHQSGSSISATMGVSSRPAKFSTDGSFSIDAGLVLLEASSQARLQSFWPVVIDNWVRKRKHISAHFGFGVSVWNRRLQGASTTFTALRVAFPVKYAGGGIAHFAQLIEYKLDHHVTRAGDSGGALLGIGGTLVGMHIAGVENLKIGFAIPAYSLMRSSAFSPSIEPVRPD
jgi:hypothetical protein